ncbi:hypothetical protein FQZ97_865010 [compost metagenome]
MILLTDNDILVKLSQSNLVGEALTVLGCTLPECYVLDTVKYSLFLNDPDKCIAKRVGNLQAYERLCELVEGCSELGAAEENLDFLEDLSQMENIDAGEQALLLHAHQLHSAGEPFWLTTGDRKALLGVHNSSSVVAKRILRQRVDCTESLVLKMLGIYGFDAINHKISGAIPVTDRFDSVLRMAFGNGRDIQHAQACLQSYLDQVAEYIRP